EHHLDRVGVSGSSPLQITILLTSKALILKAFSISIPLNSANLQQNLLCSMKVMRQMILCRGSECVCLEIYIITRPSISHSYLTGDGCFFILFVIARTKLATAFI
ncbi:hypothetical protein, partial [Paenibacillus sp. KS1]|uniref:hypothetical protein n=1 Tax=Paenibacillus sp. KS1 TaxID=1849249 RepID=UPI001C30E695